MQLALADVAYSIGQVFGAVLVLGLVGGVIVLIGNRFGVRKPFLIVITVVVLGFVLEASIVGARRDAANPTHVKVTTGNVNPFIGVSPAATVYMLPLDRHAGTLLDKASPTLRRYLPETVQLQTISAVPSTWLDNNKPGEWNAQNIAQDLLTSFSAAQGGRPVFIMAVTSAALFDPSSPQYAFVFGFLWWHKPQFAAVFGTQPMHVYQPERESARLTKMMLRYVGEVVCNRPRNTNPQSVLYESILSTTDLDRMTARLPSACSR